MEVMTNLDLVEKCIDIAKNYKTLYVMGCFGARMTEANKTRYINNGAHGSYNAKSARKKMIQAATDDTFGFDCVCLIKSILWGWNGDKSATYGGAKYASNGVPDINADSMIKVCKDVSTDFSKIEIGEAVWCKGHIGVYIGNGLAVECTPAWDNCVQITACNCTVKGYNRRNWTKHGKLPYVSYEKAEKVPEKLVQNTSNAEYYPQYKGTSNSIVDALKSMGIDSSINHRKEIAKANGIEGYKGTAQQNGTMLSLLEQGKLIKSGSVSSTGAVNTASKVEYYPKYTGDSNSLVDALKSLKIDSSYDNRKTIASKNDISGYKGSAAQNTKMLNLIKSGKLIK